MTNQPSLTLRTLRTLRILLFLAGLVAAAAAHAAGGAGNLLPANTQVGNKAMLQRGAATMNYCAGCHSAQYVRYSRLAEDLDLTEEQVMDNLVFRPGARFGDTIVSGMSTEDGAAFFGKAPPDLSVVARSRGPDWLFTYMRSFYRDPSAVTGWNNTVYENPSMPHVLWELQGIQEPHYGEPVDGGDPPVERLELVQAGLLTPGEYDASLRDLVSFLEYIGEPAALKRHAMGVWVCSSWPSSPPWPGCSSGSTGKTSIDRQPSAKVRDRQRPGPGLCARPRQWGGGHEVVPLLATRLEIP